MFDLSLLLPSLPFYLSFFAIKKVKFFKALTVYDEQKWGNSSVFPNTTIMIRTEWYQLNKYTVKAENLLQHHPHIYSTFTVTVYYCCIVVDFVYFTFCCLPPPFCQSLALGLWSLYKQNKIELCPLHWSLYELQKWLLSKSYNKIVELYNILLGVSDI